MIKLNKYIILVVLPALLALGCTDAMEDMNLSDKALQGEDLLADGLNVSTFIPTLAYNVNNITTTYKYQVEQNLNADHFSGYMMSASFNGGNANYLMNDTWNGSAYSIPAENLTSMVKFKEKALPLYSDYYSYGLILKVLSALPMVDAFGTFPYTGFGTGTDVKWDSQKVIYDAFFKELDFAVDTLSSMVGTEKENRIGATDPSSYEGNYVKLIKLANSLKLRLAMRISDVEPNRAKEIAEAAVNSQYGVLNAGDGVYLINSNYNHPLWQLGNGWKNIHMGSDMESFLKGYDDPRLGEYFQPATDTTLTPSIEGEYHGIRQGASLEDNTTYANFSLPNFEEEDPMVLFTVAESYFLRAEGALKGWSMGGTAEEFYEQGVKASFDQYRLGGVEAYLESSATPADYVDPKNDAYSYLATTDVTPKWSDATTQEEKLEKIITQKWIAIFPDGAEAWADFRRTGYPKLKPIPSSQSTNIPTGEFIKKLPIPTAMSSTAPERYKEAVNTYFGGDDNESKRVWWDVD